jgi:predicted amidohydrolase
MLAACVQLQIQPCHSDYNLHRALKMAKKAVDLGANIIVLPELFLTGFCYEDDLSDSYPYKTLDPFRNFVREHGCMIISSIEDGRSNLGFCIDSEDNIGFQPKIHPFGLEKSHFDGGSRISPIETSFGKVGLEICYDLRFPEVARKLALRGADYLVTVAQFPVSRGYHWRVLSLARAIENQIPHIACNGSIPEFCGGSMVIDSWGEILTEAGVKESIITGEVDLNHRDSVREQIPALKDRNPDIY